MLRGLAALGAAGVMFVSIAYGEMADREYGITASESQGDEMSDAVQEDSPLWSCVDDGNHVCGPNNPQGKPAACYDDGGVIVAMWPCNPWTPDMGHRDARGITTYPNGDRLNDEGETP